MVQKSILSFFSAAKVKKSDDDSESNKQEPDKNAKAKGKSSRDEDSPVKKTPKGRARVIESDSEDEAQPSTSSSPNKSDEEKENKKSPVVKNKKVTPKAKREKEVVKKSPPVKKSKGDEDMEVDDEEEKSIANGSAEKDVVEDAPSSSPSASSSSQTPKKSSASSSGVGFSPETVPPLRKTARKQMKRKSDSMESKQIEMLKKKKVEESKDKDSEESASSSQDADEKKESKTDAEKVEVQKCEDEEEEEEKIKEEVKEMIKKENEEEVKKYKKETKEKVKKEINKENEEEVKKKGKKEAKEKVKKETKKEVKKKGKKETKEKVNKEIKKEVKKKDKKETKEKVKEEIKKEDEEEPMEVDDCVEDKKEIKKEEKGKASTPSAKKPIHSFFAPRSPKKSPATTKANTSPKKASIEKEEEEEEDEEEHCSSPVKRQTQPKKKKNVIESDSEEESEDEAASEEQEGKSNEARGKEKPESPRKAEVSQKKDGKSSNDSPKASNKSPKTETKPAQSEKKPVVNPFAPKSAGAGDPGVKYNPGKEKYDPIKDAFWEHKAKVPYLALAKTLELIENTSGRLRTVEILANFLRSVIVLSPEDFLFCVYLCLNKVAPAFEATELGVGDMTLMRAIAQTSGRSVDKIKHDAEEKGDLGIVAEQSRSNQKLMFQPAKLTVRVVFDKLKEIAFMAGNASQNKKLDKIKGMFVACRFSEARFLIRSLGGKLRIGLAEQSVLQAIAQACFLTPPGQDYPPEVLNAGKGLAPDKLKAKIDNHGLILKTTYCEFPSYDKIVDVIMKEGLEELPKHCKLTPGVPLKPMLAHPTSGVSEVLKRFENAKFTCEFKYDGERAQIHMKEDGSVSIYSRNQEDNTTKYPDIISRLKNSLGENVKSCVIDSEAVAWDKEKKQILPFQILSTRKRKDANEKDIKVQVCVFPFDLLYLNGEPLVREPFEKRRALLKENFSEVEGEFVFAKSMDSTNTEDIEEFLEESIKGDCEGLMVKTLDVDATYEIAKRSRNWLKLKKDYLDGVGDTIDAAVIGGYWGKGKRKGVYGCFLLACYDPDNEEFQSLCKIGTGFSDEQLQTHTAFLKEHVIEKPKSYYRYDSSHEPDIWFEAVQVWEIKCADLSISPHHKAASGVIDPEKGISLRFPRFLRIREDKTPENATSSSQIADLYNNQAQIQNRNSSSKGVEEDFY